MSDQPLLPESDKRLMFFMDQWNESIQNILAKWDQYITLKLEAERLKCQNR